VTKASLVFARKMLSTESVPWGLMTRVSVLQQPVFIGGVPRSGTTLLRVMVDSHPAISCGPEIRVLASLGALRQRLGQALSIGNKAPGADLNARLDRAFANLTSSLLEPALAASGKRRIAEKTPSNLLWLTQLGNWFPDARLIHVIRDGRDVAASLVKTNWIDHQTGQPYEYVQSVQNAARFWSEMVRTGCKAGRSPLLQERYLEVRYEDLVLAPEQECRRICEFLGEDFAPQMLDHHLQDHNYGGPDETSAKAVSGQLTTSSIGRWRGQFSRQETSDVNRICGPVLRELGYEPELA
jgi:hypothetical protein